MVPIPHTFSNERLDYKMFQKLSLMNNKTSQKLKSLNWCHKEVDATLIITGSLLHLITNREFLHCRMFKISIIFK